MKVPTALLTRRDTISVLSPLLILAMIMGDVFLYSVSSDWRIVGILGIFLYYIYRFKRTSSTTFLMALALLIIAYVQYILTDPALYHVPEVPKAERTAVWLYLFLVMGVVQKWREK